MNRAFDHLRINAYRALKSIDLPDLGQVNIFVGDNNSGKTSLLEAIAILCNPLDPFQWLEVANRRLYSTSLIHTNFESIEWLFPKLTESTPNLSLNKNLDIEDSYQKISIQANGYASMKNGDAVIRGFTAQLRKIYSSKIGKAYFNNFPVQDSGSMNEDEDDISETPMIQPGLELEVTVDLTDTQGTLSLIDLAIKDLKDSVETFRFWENQRFFRRSRTRGLVRNITIFPAYTGNPVDMMTRFSRSVEVNGKDSILNLMRLFDPKVLDIEILSFNSKPSFYIQYEETGLAPLYVFGDGFKRAFQIALAVSILQNSGTSVLLIDEIETSIHVSALSHIFSWLIQICRQCNIQLFVTTHSLEAIDAMLFPETTPENWETTIEDIVAFRLSSKGKPPQRFSGNFLSQLRSERGLDVR
jgi:energy-coupling factor transporter ATP-binding protein EcfA2